MSASAAIGALGGPSRASMPRGFPAREAPARVTAPLTAARLAAPRLGTITTGPCTVTGEVQDLAGQAVSGATVVWGYYNAGNAWVFGNRTTTTTDGSFGFSGVTATQQGELDVYLPGSGVNGYQKWDLTFAALPAQNVFTLRPSVAPFSTSRTSDAFWQVWTSVVVETWGSQGGGTTTLGPIGDAYVMAPDYDQAVVYYFPNQATEWIHPPAAVAEGGVGEASITVSQDDAQSVLLVKPYWASGKPGSGVSVRMGGWPAGSEARFYGRSENPSKASAKTYTRAYSSSGADATLSLSIPTGASAGYDYEIHAVRVDGGSVLDINDFFQVCTLRSSKASVARGGAIRLSGRIPLAGHWGTRLAPAGKSVVLFKRTTAAGQPKRWKPTSWTKVTWRTTDRTGAYVFPLQHPRRTTWYAVRYPGSYNAKTGQYYWDAFTSVLKVRVY
jgi:hypothetical protein